MAPFTALTKAKRAVDVWTSWPPPVRGTADHVTKQVVRLSR